MIHSRSNRNVCSTLTTVQLARNNVIEEVSVQGGCDGNLKGVCSLLQGRKAEEAILLLEGIRCGDKDASCPNEIAQCLKEAVSLAKGS